jgi:2'-5' RNA ligase
VARPAGEDGGGVRGSRSRRRPGAVRLFVALELPEPVRVALARWAGEAVCGAVAEARPLPAESLHVTLCFLGGCSPDEVAAIAGAVEDGVAAAGRSAVVLEVGEAIWLPRRRARVCAVALREVAAGAETADGALAGLQGAVAARLVAGGWYAPERRPFLPHVTVARLRTPLRGRVPALVAPKLAPFRAPGVVLLRSWPGSRYEPLARFDLPEQPPAPG